MAGVVVAHGVRVVSVVVLHICYKQKQDLVNKIKVGVNIILSRFIYSLIVCFETDGHQSFTRFTSKKSTASTREKENREFVHF